MPTQWYMYEYFPANVNGTRCNSQCMTGCTCILGDDIVTRNCTDEANVSQNAILYPLNVSYLSWADSILHSIKPKAFMSMPDLTILHLKNVSLQYLELGVFAGLKSLLFLSLEKNVLTDIAPGIFTELTEVVSYNFSSSYHRWEKSNLTMLDLSNNHVTDLIPGVFSDITSLEWLYLSNNFLTELLPGLFDGLHKLQWIDLSNNSLTEIVPGVLNELPGLNYLFLSNNYLTHVVPAAFPTAFSNSPRLTVFDLSYNDLSNLTGLPSSITAFLAIDNKLTTIAPGVLNNLNAPTDLTAILLSNNELTEIKPGAFSNLPYLTTLILSQNQLATLQAGVFSDLPMLNTLNLSMNYLTELSPDLFTNFDNLLYLDLSNNHLTTILVGNVFGNVFSKLLRQLKTIQNIAIYDFATTMMKFVNTELYMLHDIRGTRFPDYMSMDMSFGDVDQLDVIQTLQVYSDFCTLWLSYNQLSTLHPDAFKAPIQLRYLYLDHNHLNSIPQKVFHTLRYLKELDLSANNLVQIPTNFLLHSINLQRLNLRDNPLSLIEPQTFAGLNKTAALIVSDPSTCCFALAHCKCEKAPSPFLTCKRLLPYNGLHIALWFLGVFALLGNGLSFYVRYKQKDKGNKVQFVLISNLSTSDFCMGIYIIILLSADMYYAQYFPSFSESWRSSLLCRIGGAVSVLSSEASVFFVTLISIDRLQGVKYTFSTYRLRTRHAHILVTLMWLVALMLSITTFALSLQGNPDIYAVSEICVGLPISRYHHHMINETSDIKFYFFNREVESLTSLESLYTGSKSAMYFSLAIFTVLNLVCFLIVGYCYLALLLSARKTARTAGRSPINEEITIAVRSFFIVFTDFCCWVAVGIYSILVQTGAVKDDPDAYIWIATFVLPINSAMNPFLYTLASVISSKVSSRNKN